MQLSAITASLGRFFAELQRRKVLRVAATYLVGAWVVLQVAVALQTAWALSAAFSGTILNLMIIGFPAVVGLTWFFEITPQGIKRTSASGDGTIAKLQTTDYVLAGALVLVFCIGAVQLFWPRERVQETAAAAEPKAATLEDEKPKVDPPRLGDKSIAVLPFANLSKKDNDAVFADGLTEEILDVLAHVNGLRVISRTSSFAFKGKDTPLPEIAKQLGVRHILEGSVRHDGGTIRITAQLIDVKTDTHLWSETFERDAEEAFAIQDDIARAVGRALNLEINAGADAQGAPTKNLEAYRLYLKGKDEYVALTKTSVLSSIELYKRAIALDPHFAEAYAELAWAYAAMRDLDPAGWSALQPLIGPSAEAALKINPKLARAIAVQSMVARIERNWATSVGLAQKAVAIEPSNSGALTALGVVQLFVGNVEQSQNVYEEVDRVDPLFGGSPLTFLLVAFARGDDEGIASYGAKLRGAKGLYGLLALIFLATQAQEQGDHAKAEQLLRQLAASSGRISLVEPMVAALRSPAARDRAADLLREEASRDPTFDPMSIYLMIGAYDQFLDAANALVVTGNNDARANRMMFFVWHVVAKGQGSNPKLKQLFRHMGLVDYWRAHGWPDRCRAKGEDDFECS